MKDRLRAAGIPVTPHAQAAGVDDVPRAAETTGWPVMIKPVFGSGSKCTHRVESAADFEARHRAGDFADLAAQPAPVQVERLVRFESEYHCDGVLHAGTVHRAAVSRYFTPPLQIHRDLDCSHVMEQRGPLAEGVLDLHRRVVAALGLTDGVTHLEVFGTEQGLLVGEIAVRPGGLGIPRMWWHAFGIDLWEEFVRTGLGEPPSEPAPGSRPGLVGRTQLPALPGIRESAAAVPGVLEVRTPEESGTGNLEAFFGADDDAGIEDLNTRLHSLPGLPVRTGRPR
nr:ATP-grasp domain-containing protein [Streptomyces sp. HNM0574]